MPQTNLAGHRAEDAMTAELVAALTKDGLPARAFPIFHVVTARGSVLSKPDFELADGGVHIGSAKFGAEKEFMSFKTAQEYQASIPLSTELQGKHLGEVFAVTYPSSPKDRFVLHILAKTGRHDEIGLVLDSLKEVANAIEKATRGEFDKVLLSAESPYEEARRLLNFAAIELAGSFGGVSTQELETVFGGHTFFQSVLAGQVPKDEKRQTLRLGAAFLFVNQVLFYLLLSREAARVGDDSYPPLPTETVSPEELQTFFDRVYQKDYEPIYGINVTHFLKSEQAQDASIGIVRAIVSMGPKLDAPDLAGQIFQTLIPFSLRKPLGAHYTNPNAARLLARLAIRSGDISVLDPACGSGTLLIAAYRRIFELVRSPNVKKLHTELVEQRITGIDAMAFSAHLAAVGLALQQPLHETNYIRIARADSTRLSPGDPVKATEEVLSSEMRQSTLDDEFHSRDHGSPRHKGPVKLGRKEPPPFQMKTVDLLIMNPPFTSWENMAADYRNELRRIYEYSFGRLIFLRPSQQLFFLFLAEKFIKPGKSLASVLPLTTFTVHAFHKWLANFLQNWRVQYIIVGLGRASFSEDTSLTECMIVATKEKPSNGSYFVIVGVKKSPVDLTPEDIDRICDVAERKQDAENDVVITKIFPQHALDISSLTLAGASLSLLKEYDESIRLWSDIIVKSDLPFVSFEALAKRNAIAITGGIRTGEHISFYGKKALIACRSEDRMRGDADRLVYESETSTHLKLRDVIGDTTFSFPKSAIGHALRRFTYVRKMDISETPDFCVSSPVEMLHKVMERMYGARDSQKFLRRIRERSVKYPGGRWSSRLAVSSGQICLMRRLDLAAPNTFVLCVWDKENLFPACEGYAIRMVTGESAKLLTMWYNSTPFVIQMLSHSTLTRGTWLKFEEFAVDLLPLPDFTRLRDEDKQRIAHAFDKANQEQWPCLLDQLRNGSVGRRIIDDLILQLMGVESSEERVKIQERLRIGAFTAIETLRQTMVVEEEEEEGDEEA